MRRKFFDTIDQQAIKLAEDNAMLKAENARLAAVVHEMRDAMHRYQMDVDDPPPHDHVKMMRCADACSSEALERLLAPTIEVLRQATLRPITWQDDVKKELYRLSTLIKT